MTQASDTYHAAEQEMRIPSVSERGRTNQNPDDIGFWALVREDFDTHERKIFEQGFWAIFVHRLGNWRMGQPKLIRAPATLIYRILFKLMEWLCGISLWYTVKLGRRVRIWHHSGIVVGARAVGNDVHLRQNTTIGVGQTGKNDLLPIIADGVDIGAGACIGGAVYVGRNAKIGANALVITDIPDKATAIGNPVILSKARGSAPASTGKAVPLAAPRMPDQVTTATTVLPDEAMTGAPRDMGVIALLGSGNLDYLAMNFAEAEAQYGLKIKTYVPPFGQGHVELLQPDDQSPLMAALKDQPSAALIVERAEDLFAGVYAAPLSLAEADMDAYLEEALEPLFQMIHAARAKLEGPIFVLSLAMLTRSPLMQADRHAAQGLAALIARANERLSGYVAEMTDTYLLDAGDMIAQVGRDAAHPGQFWHLGRVPFSTGFGAYLSRRVLGALLSLRGQTARILVLDLDNTLWGGVLGEDGMEGLEIGGVYPGSAYRAFQDALKGLSQRGIALAVASKNDEDLAVQMISDHPEMGLRMDDIVAHYIGWEEKALGISDMLDDIGLGAASCMFIDDNPVEREKVRKNIPDCIVPAFPNTPEALVGWLLDNPYLDCLELTASDLKRTGQYKTRAGEKAAKRSFENIDDFYRDLEMSLTFEPYNAANQKRVLQLFAKTNQFNTTLRRHAVADVEALIAEGSAVYAVGVADRHSAYELMGVLVLRPDAAMRVVYPQDAALHEIEQQDGLWWVDSFLLSCRILGRTVETAIVAWATQEAARRGAQALMGYVIEAPRNTPVRDVFAKSGMERVEMQHDLGAGGLWRHDVTEDALPVPDYFTLRDAPPPINESARPKTLKPEAPVIAAAKPRDIVALDPAQETRLAEVFRKTFRLDDTIDLETATMDSLPQWDSLGHLKLAMEIDQKLGVHLSGDQLGQIDSYADLKATIGTAV